MLGIRIKNAKEELLKGNPIIFGTDTINGIGCLYDDVKCIKKIYSLKKRDKSKALILLMSDIDMVLNYFKIGDMLYHTIKEYMPGGLTVISQAKVKMNKYIMNKGKASFRIPGRKSMIKLIEEIKKPIASTSLNVSGDEIIKQRDEAINTFEGIHIFNNLTSSDIASTVIIMENGCIKILRKGKAEINSIFLKEKIRS